MDCVLWQNIANLCYHRIAWVNVLVMSAAAIASHNSVISVAELIAIVNNLGNMCSDFQIGSRIFLYEIIVCTE